MAVSKASSSPRAKAKGPASPAREAELFEIARQVLVELGVAGFTMDEVARRARCSKPTLYRRWPGKAQLIMEIVRGTRDTLPPIDTGSLRTDLLVLVRNIVKGTHERGLIFLGIAHAMQTDSELAAAWHSWSFSEGKAHLDSMIEKAIKRGELQRAPDLELFYRVMPGSLLWASFVEEVEDLDQFAEQLMDEVLIPLLQAVRRAPVRVTSPKTKGRRRER